MYFGRHSNPLILDINTDRVTTEILLILFCISYNCFFSHSVPTAFLCAESFIYGDTLLNSFHFLYAIYRFFCHYHRDYMHPEVLTPILYWYNYLIVICLKWVYLSLIYLESTELLRYIYWYLSTKFERYFSHFLFFYWVFFFT